MKQTCTGKSLINEGNMGGHIEDYIPNPNDKTKIPSKLRWVPVSQSFKKGD